MSIVIFDLDGTIVDSGDNITAAINHTRKHLGLHPIEKPVVIDTINREEVNSAMMFYGTPDFTAEQRDIFENFYIEVCDSSLSTYEGTTETIQKLKSVGYRLSVATNGASVFAKKMLSSLDLLHFFDFVVGYDDVARPKPMPDMLDMILGSYNADSQERLNALMVGDSIKDIKAANAAGIRSAHATWGYTSEPISAHYSLKKPSDIINFLEINFKVSDI